MTRQRKSTRLLLLVCFYTALVLTFAQLVYTTQSAHAQACVVPTVPAFPTKTGLYVLAYDNGDETAFNLSSQYDATVNRLVQATVNIPDSLVVILADLSGAEDSHLLILENGNLTRLDCIPNAAGQLDTSIKEVDTADADTLGNFLTWGLDTFNPSGNNIHFSFIGHGNPVSPHTVPPIYELIEAEENQGQNGSQIIAEGDQLSPLPSRLDANPSFTDHHAPAADQLSLITPHALATALKRATNDGSRGFDTVDLLHCFAASIDELHEVAPYTKGIVASPNYAFFDPRMPGVGFEQLFLEDIVVAYDGFHPPTGHPHIIMGIEADTIIETVDKWNEISTELMSEFKSNADATSNNLLQAYRNSVHYDTTVCEEDQDWALEPPDALVDMRSFAAELQPFYTTSNPGLASDLSQIGVTLGGSIIATAAQNGIPYFDETNSQVWTFFPGESGVSLFSPFEATVYNDVPYLPWQTLWYTDTLSYQLPEDVTITNPHPFQFVTNPAGSTWADVLAAYWAHNEMRPGRDVNTFFCPAELITMSSQAADMEIEIANDDTAVLFGDSFTMTISVTNKAYSTAIQPVLAISPSSESLNWINLVSTSQPDACSKGRDEMRCSWNFLRPGRSEVVELVYELNGNAATANQPFKGVVYSDNFDPHLLNNSFEVQLGIVPVENIPSPIFLPVIRQ